MAEDEVNMDPVRGEPAGEPSTGVLASGSDSSTSLIGNTYWPRLGQCPRLGQYATPSNTGGYPWLDVCIDNRDESETSPETSQ